MTTDEKRDMVEGIARKLLGIIGEDTLDFLRDNGIGVKLGEVAIAVEAMCHGLASAFQA